MPPFGRYLKDDVQDTESYSQQPDNAHPGALPMGSSNSIQLRMPQFMMLGPPTLAPGGGAEVLLPSLYGGTSCDLGSAWLNNNLYELTPPASRYSTSPLPLPNPHPQTNSSSNSAGIYTTSESSSCDRRSGVNFALSSYAPALLPDREEPLVDASLPFAAPSAFGLPVYSSSGFDLLSIMARVSTRPNPTLNLGPVDMSCSFVVVDVRRYDAPVVYASPTFCTLTGYTEHEILGRNCRFLQSPDGHVQKGEERRFTSPLAVSHLKKCLVADKECQTSMINYRKGGSAFINLISVIPIPGGGSNAPEEADQVAYHIGFQVDLTEQPSAILERVRGGTYVVNYTHNPIIRAPNPSTTTSRDRRITSSTVIPVSKNLRCLLSDDQFLKSIPLSLSTTLIPYSSLTDKLGTVDSYDGNQLLSMLLLESSPDFVHVLSLRGLFLYVAPSIRRVLGYDPEEVVGKSISDYCYPADLVPLMRELKESSATPISLDGQAISPQIPPKTVDLLFRMMSKLEGYVWVECRGRLHVEPGKGRKAIILSGRRRRMPKLTWALVSQTGGLVPSVNGTEQPKTEQEFWATLSQNGTFLFVGAAIRDVLGWGVGEVIGKRLEDLINVGQQTNFNPKRIVHDAIHQASTNHSQIALEMRKKDGLGLQVTMALYHSTDPLANSPEPVICQVKATQATPALVPVVHPAASDVFEEMDTTRNTSWQYELQQLKFANQRLLEEVELLEAHTNKSRALKLPESSTTFTSVPNTTPEGWTMQNGLHTRQWDSPMESRPLEVYTGNVHYS